MKKRRLIPVLCAAAVAVSLAGCSGSSGSATEKGADTQAPKAEAGAETGKEEDCGEKKEEAGASKDEKLIIYSWPCSRRTRVLTLSVWPWVPATR